MTPETLARKWCRQHGDWPVEGFNGCDERILAAAIHEALEEATVKETMPTVSINALKTALADSTVLLGVIHKRGSFGDVNGAISRQLKENRAALKGVARDEHV